MKLPFACLAQVSSDSQQFHQIIDLEYFIHLDHWIGVCFTMTEAKIHNSLLLVQDDRCKLFEIQSKKEIYEQLSDFSAFSANMFQYTSI